MTGWPMAVARYRPVTSQAVSDGGAPSAAPMGISATAIIDELTGLSTVPRSIGAISLRSNPSSGVRVRCGRESTGIR